MTISFWLDAQTEKAKEEYDVVIVGAGITGAAAAYWLSRKTELKIGVFDSGIAGGGASGRNGGFILRGVMSYYNKLVQAHGRDTARALLHFNEQTQNYLQEFVEKFGDSFSFEKCGSYLLAASLDELDDLSESAELMKEDGFELEYLKNDPVDRGYYGAIFNPCDMALNPYALVKALLFASGLDVHENEKVFQIGWQNHQALLRTPKRLISAGRVLLCTNAYLPLLLNEMSGIGKPVRGQILLTRPLEQRILDKLCYANYGHEYFRQLADGRFLLGGCREPFIEEEQSFADTTTANVQSSLQNYLKDRFPEVAGASIDYRWSGIMYFTQDGLPVIGEVPDKPGVLFAAGCNGHGMGYSLALAKLLVEYALDGANPGIFDSRRLQLAVK